MENNVINNNPEVRVFDFKTMFQKPINFKIYELNKETKIDVKHSHNYMQMWYVCKGVCNHFINDKSYKMVKGDLFILPPFVPHKTIPFGDEDLKIIGCEFSANFFGCKLENFNYDKNLFDFAYIEPFLVSEDMVKPKLNLSFEAQSEVESLMYDMLKEYNEEKIYYDMLIKADLLKVLTIVSREYANCNNDKESEELIDKYRSAISKAMAYIQENYTQDIHLDEVCRVAMMSKTYFCYIFKTITGKTFAEYVIDLRIQKSIDLLQKTDLPITKICYDVGFNDITHFCRTFKRTVGVSAKYYRKATIISQ